MPFQFTAQEISELQLLRAQGAAAGRYDATYRRIRDILAARGGLPNNEPVDVANARRWFAGAEQANAGEGFFAAFIRLYSARQYALYSGSAPSSTQIQDASNAVANEVLDDILLRSNGILPTVAQIGEQDATAVGNTLFQALPAGSTARANNAAWAGTLLFSQLGSDQSGRLLGPPSNPQFDTLDDLRNLMFAYDAFRMTMRSIATQTTYSSAAEIADDASILLEMPRSAALKSLGQAIVATAWTGASQSIQTQIEWVIGNSLMNLMAGSVAESALRFIRDQKVDWLLGALEAMVNGSGAYRIETSNFQSRATPLFASLSNVGVLGSAVERLDQLGSSTRGSIVAIASGNDSRGLAYRNALFGLSPVAVDGLNVAGRSELGLYSPSQSSGMTANYIRDRTDMLAWFMERMRTDVARDQASMIGSGTDNYVYLDSSSGQRFSVASNNPSAALNPIRLTFGGGTSDVLTGNNAFNGDRLYGMGGNDYIAGRGGNDYLEGGAGLDVYQYAAGDGADTILDSDGKGVVRYVWRDASNVERSLILGDASVRVSDIRWTSADGLIGYDKVASLDAQGNTIAGRFDLKVDLASAPGNSAGGSITIKDFNFAAAETSGWVGIRLKATNPAAFTSFRSIVGGTLSASGGSDDLGNPFVNANTIGADVGNTLNGSAGVDKIESGGGGDRVRADRVGTTVDLATIGDWILSGDGRDWVSAGSGNDLIEAGADGVFGADVSGDLVNAGAGDDHVFGDTSIALADAIARGDPLSYPAAAGQGQTAIPRLGDFIIAGAGDDLVVTTGADDFVWGGLGKDSIVTGAGNDFIRGGSDVSLAATGQSGIPNIVVTTYSRNFTFAAIEFPTQLAQDSYGLAFTGRTIVLGDAILETGNGESDTIYSGSGNDLVYADGGDDYVDGGSGNDALSGGGGADLLVGGLGNDTLSGDDPADAIAAQGGDVLDGGDGIDWLYGLGGDDILFGGAGSDRLFGGAGNDILMGSQGGDGKELLYGGSGRDTYVFNRGDGIKEIIDPDDLDGTYASQAANPNPDKSIIVLGEGIIRSDIKFRKGSLLIDLGGGDEIHLTGFEATGTTDPTALRLFEYIQLADGSVITYDDMLAQGFEIIGSERTGVSTTGVDLGGDDQPGAGFNGADTTLYGTNNLITGDKIYGLGGNDILKGLAGNDSLYGGTGVDTLEGGDGDDHFDGGANTDYLYGGAGNDTYVFGSGAGFDTIEDLQGANTVQFSAGTTAADISARLDTGAGGIYTLRLDRSNDDRLTVRVDLAPGAANTMSYVFADASTYDTRAMLQAGFKQAVFFSAASGVTAIDLTASAYNDGISGSAHADRIEGAGGDDTLAGGNGNDTLTGGAGNDDLKGEAGDDLLQGGTGGDTYYLAPGSGRDIIDEVAGGSNILKAGVTFANLTALRVGDDLAIGIRNSTEQVLLRGAYLPAFGSLADWIVTTTDAAPTSLDVVVNGAPLPTIPSTPAEAFADFDVRWRKVQNDSMVLGGYTKGSDGVYVKTTAYGTFRWALAAVTDSPNNAAQFSQATSATTLANPTPQIWNLNLVRVTGGDASNTITAQGGGMVDGGAGDDVIRVDGVVVAPFAGSILGGAPGGLLYGGAGNDRLLGSEGNDVLIGGSGDDLLEGGEGNDRYLLMEGGSDVVFDTGSLSLDSVRSNADSVDLPAAVRQADLQFAWSDELFEMSRPVRATTNTPYLKEFPLKVMTAVLAVSWGSVAGGGSVRIVMPHSDDKVDSGIETLRFGDGTSLTRAQLLLLAGAHDLNPNAAGTVIAGDNVDGEAGNDTITGNGILRGSEGNDTITGGAGINSIAGDEGADLLAGGAGNDLLGFGIREFIGAGNTYRGGTGDDIILGSQASDIYLFDRGDGSDIIGDYFRTPGGAPMDQGWLLGASLYGNTAGWSRFYTDAYFYNPGSGPAIPVDYSGLDTIRFGAGINPADVTFQKVDGTQATGDSQRLGADLMLGLGGGDQIRLANWFKPSASFDSFSDLSTSAGVGRNAVNRIEFADGTYWDQTYLANRSGNVVNGTAGNDNMVGTALADWLSGGVGNDTYSVNSAGDTVNEASNAGTDSVNASVSHALTANVENLTLTGNAAINGSGNALNNLITGNSAVNTLSGGAGNDTLSGGAGDDTLAGGGGDDTALVSGADGQYVIVAYQGSTYVLDRQANRDGQDKLTAIAHLRYQTGDTVIDLATARNALDYVAAYPDLIGYYGNNESGGFNHLINWGVAEGRTITFDAQGYLAANPDLVPFYGNDLRGATSHYIMYGSVEARGASLNGGAGADLVQGGDGHDLLDGGGEGDGIYGGAGNDTLIGGSGNDYLDGGSGFDSAIYSGARAAYGITPASVQGEFVVSGPEGSDTLNGVESLRFSDSITLLISPTGAGGVVEDFRPFLYLASNPDLITAIGANPDAAMDHYVRWGHAEGRPISGFHAYEYLASNPDLLATYGGNTTAGIEHYVRWGHTEGRPVTAFDGAQYQLNYPEVAAVFGTAEESLATHYVLFGHAEGRTDLKLVFTGTAGDDTLTGNAASNTLIGNAGNDTLSGGTGSDTLQGGTGADVYKLSRGDGADSVVENDATANVTDVASFAAGIAVDQLWFRMAGSGLHDLEVSVIGTNDRFLFQNWDLGSQTHVEQFKTTDGNKTLLASQVQGLLSAMAGFAPPPGASSLFDVPSLSQPQRDTILAAWQ